MGIRPGDRACDRAEPEIPEASEKNLTEDNQSLDDASREDRLQRVHRFKDEVCADGSKWRQMRPLRSEGAALLQGQSRPSYRPCDAGHPSGCPSDEEEARREGAEPRGRERE